MVIKFATGIRVYGKRTAGGFCVHGYEFGSSAANDGDEGRCGQREEVVGFDGRGEGAEVFLAILEGAYQYSHGWRWRGACLAGRTYAAEEMAYEDDQLF